LRKYEGCLKVLVAGRTGAGDSVMVWDTYFTVHCKEMWG